MTDRYKALTTSFELKTVIGKRSFSRSYCDDVTGSQIYTTKPPVAKLSLTPIPQAINTNLSWDVSQSGSATGTIDRFSLTFGGPTSTGDLLNQDWAIDPLTGVIQYTQLGDYVATLVVTDTLGVVSTPAQVNVAIVEFQNLQFAFIGTNDNGVYVLSPGNPAAAINTGLTDLELRNMVLHPAYRNNTDKHLWVTSISGIAFTINSGTAWTEITNTTLGEPVDPEGATTSDLDNIGITFDLSDPDIIYLLRVFPGTNSWMYKSTDYGETWTNTKIT